MHAEALGPFQHWVEGVSPRNAVGMCRKVVIAQRVLDLLGWPSKWLYFAASGSQRTNKVKDFPQILDLKFKSKTHED